MTRARTGFLVARREVEYLIKTARSLPDQIVVGGRMSPQESQLRHVVVALVGVLQAFVTELLEEKADQLGDNWEDLSRNQKRYVSVQARKRLQTILEKCTEDELVELSKIDSLRKDTSECAGWFTRPSSLARSHRVRLDGFLQNNGAISLDNAISRHGSGEIKFFNWLSKHHPRFRGIEDVLNIVIATRNDVAHGNFERRLTMREARLCRVLVYRVIYKIDRFVESGGV